MKKIIYALLVLLPFMACTEDIMEDIKTGDIAGSVSDQTTGEPVATVNVKLYSIDDYDGGYGEDNWGNYEEYYYNDYGSNSYTAIASTVTGSDGSFSFKGLNPGVYEIEIEKSGYEYNYYENINVKVGETTPIHMLIKRKPAMVTADKELLDFGDSKSLNTLSFNIVNDSYEDLSWTIEENCEWITQVKDQSGTLKYGKTETIVVVIDRSKLESGENTSVIVVKSSNGNTEVRVRAIGEYKALPILEIYDASNIRAYSATLNAEVTSVGEPAYSERGFVYSTSTNPTIENCIAKVAVPKNSEAKYSCEIKELELGKTYYARAYAISGLGTTYSTYSTAFTTAPVLPVLTTQEVTDINYENERANFHGTIVSVGEPAYTECGFVYGTSPNPTINDNKRAKNGMSGTGAFSAITVNLPTDQTFYVRAYAINEAGVAYGEDVVVEPEFIVLSSAKLMVQPTDLGFVNWESANIMCNNSTLGGYTDWRLPTKEELMVLYNNRDKIGGFTHPEYVKSSWTYWSSSSEDSYNYYTINMYYGDLESDVCSYSNYVRAVRTIQ